MATTRAEQQQIAGEIIRQLGGMGRLKIMINARDAVYQWVQGGRTVRGFI
jgi:hypothetical protein